MANNPTDRAKAWERFMSLTHPDVGGLLESHAIVRRAFSFGFSWGHGAADAALPEALDLLQRIWDLPIWGGNELEVDDARVALRDFLHSHERLSDSIVVEHVPDRIREGYQNVSEHT